MRVRPYERLWSGCFAIIGYKFTRRHAELVFETFDEIGLTTESNAVSDLGYIITPVTQKFSRPGTSMPSRVPPISRI